MAIRWAVANGNWSNVATWDGGVALPGVGDTVHADGKTVTIDQNIQVDNITTFARTGGTAGGSFIANNSRILNCTLNAGNTPCLVDSSVSPAVVTIIGTVNAGITAAYGINKTGSGTLTISGDVNGALFNANQGFGIFIANTAIGCTINITGNVSGSMFNNQLNYGILVLPVCTINITGNVSGSMLNINNSGIRVDSSATINITGNVIAGNSYNGSNYAIWCNNSTPIINIIGIVIASNNTVAISATQYGAIIKVNGSLVNTNGIMAICSNSMYLGNATTQWKFQEYGAGDKSLYSAGVQLGNPNTSDVRSLILFGPNNELVGTCHVPPKSSTVVGVPCDDGVGTWAFDANLITRLQNCATVESVGEQLEALM